MPSRRNEGTESYLDDNSRYRSAVNPGRPWPIPPLTLRALFHQPLIGSISEPVHVCRGIGASCTQHHVTHFVPLASEFPRLIARFNFRIHRHTFWVTLRSILHPSYRVSS